MIQNSNLEKTSLESTGKAIQAPNPAAELIVIFALSFVYRIYMLVSENAPWQFIPLAFHGVVADLAFPFACSVLSFYAGRAFLIEISHKLNFLLALLICFDFAHFASFRSRVNTACLNPDIMAFISLETRLIFASAIVVLAVFFRHIRKDTTVSRTRLKLLTFTSMLLLLINSLNPEIKFATNNWKDYWKSFSFSKRARPATDSLSSIYQLHVQEVTAFQGAAFVESPFFEKSLKKFPDQAKKNSSCPLIAKLPRVWIQKVSSISEVKKAFNGGFKGIEATVIYSEEEMNFFVLSSFLNISSIRELPTLEKFLHSLECGASSEHFILLNLKELNSSTSLSALKKLIGMHDRLKIKNNLLFAAKDPYMLAELTQAGLNTVWRPDYDPSVAVFDSYLIKYIKAAAVLSGCKLISLPSATLNDKIINDLGAFPLMSYESGQNPLWNSTISDDLIRVLIRGNGEKG
jgi:hypothetical protein